MNTSLADGLALMFWIAFAGLMFLIVAALLERLLSPQSRVHRRLRQIEEARAAWKDRVVEGQRFFKEEP